ncbi:nitrile hydratase subunit alpha [Kovacikia minuta CCNUW1]|uniref:nitrile hydratase subunit alpha n=1 Tax=Kovacikia minuta TaxID=2931930 RepID=UPI001CCC2B28|nr:nitrile hydratase subunit alpha [Kovacikia minuta]UBF24775.1 nitrile hydratase subunit alpha [Kovacikia minuta CCNUW1]
MSGLNDVIWNLMLLKAQTDSDFKARLLQDCKGALESLQLDITDLETEEIQLPKTPVKIELKVQENLDTLKILVPPGVIVEENPEGDAIEITIPLPSAGETSVENIKENIRQISSALGDRVDLMCMGGSGGGGL